MTLTRTWYSDGNSVASDSAAVGKSFIWALKCFLKGTLGTVDARGKWTVVTCSDGATVSSSDLWTDTYNAAKLVAADAAAARSWIVMQSPAGLGPYQILVDFTGSADGGSSACIRFWATKGTFIGGTVSARPTSVVEFQIHSTVSDRTQIWDTSANASKFHYTTDANGNFWFAMSKTGSGIFHTLMGFQVLIEGRVGDVHNAIGLLVYRASGRGACDGNNNDPPFGSAGPTSKRISGRDSTNSVTFSVGELCIPMPQPDGNYFCSAITTPNVADGGFDAFPAYVLSNRASYMGIRGRIADAYIVPGATVANGVPVGAVQPASGTIEQMVIGNLLLPFGVAPSL